MNLFEELNLKPVKNEPDVWVSRLVIIKKIAPKVEAIRDIRLTRGLNIICAEETKRGDSNSAEITGHSAGKTTFCRLIRYVLGEKTFGTRTAMELIRKAMPDGYVAAEIYVHGKRWAVRRPFGSGRMTYIKEDSSIEELFDQKGRSVTQESYHQEIGLESLLERLGTSDIVQTGEAIQWAHILSWCTRDQEARFQSIHEWRSPRSEAEAPSFRFPKAGPLFVMRTVLGLFLENELKDEERLARLQQQKDELVEKIEDTRREPQYWVNLHDSKLRQILKSLFKDEQDIDDRPLRSGDLFPEDLERLTEKARMELENSLDNYEQEKIANQKLIDDFSTDIGGLKKELDEWEFSSTMGAAAVSELDPAMQAEQKRKIEEFKSKVCRFGGVLIQDCSYFNDRQNTIKITEFKDIQLMKKAEEKRKKELQSIEIIKKKINDEISEILKKRQDAMTKRDFLQSAIKNQNEMLGDLNGSYNNLLLWMTKRDHPDANEQLNILRKNYEAIEEKIITIENRLAKLLKKHKENKELLGSIFSGIIRSILPSGHYNGEVKLEKRELSFQITYGSTMTGEAVETLAVLLSDISSMVYCTVSETAHFPGFLLHDSPREADLSIGIYYSFIRFVAGIQDHFSSPDSCPFQYVITTTTPPPKELDTDKFVKLRLNAARIQELLFRANIAIPSQIKAFK